MDDMNYPSNSHASKRLQQEDASKEKHVKKVIKGTAKVKKKGEIRKAADSFITEDIRSVGSYVLIDVIVPAIKNTIVNVVKDGIEMIFFGEARRSDRKAPGSYVSYSRYSDPRDTRRREELRSASRFDYDDIIFETRGDAEAVLDEMGNMIEQYDFVSIGDMYDIAELTPPPYTSTKYGWTSIRYAEIKRTRDGCYIIDMPKARPRDI